MLQQSYFLASNLETKFFYSSFFSTTASLIFFAIYVYLDLKINLDVKKIERNFRPPETISFWELKTYINNLEKSGFSVRKHIIYKNYLYSYPLILISMVLLGCVLSIKKDRIKKNILKIVIGIVVGIVFHFFCD